LKIASLEKNNNDYDRSVVFTAEARSDLHWWVVDATNENGVFLQVEIGRHISYLERF
jgi:hypothetical protein